MVQGGVKGAVRVGDFTLDPRGWVFLKSLKTLVVADACLPSPSLLSVVREYGAESLVHLGWAWGWGPFPEEWKAVLEEIGSAFKLYILSAQAQKVPPEWGAAGVEVHRELVWGQYRFTEVVTLGTVDLYFRSTIGKARSGLFQHFLRVGSGLTPLKLPVFLKGLGQLVVPSQDHRAKGSTVLSRDLGRYDIFALGHSRVFPVGKVSEVRKIQRLGRVPLALSVLGHHPSGGAS